MYGDVRIIYCRYVTIVRKVTVCKGLKRITKCGNTSSPNVINILDMSIKSGQAECIYYFLISLINSDT